jgi:hypothetical protein
MDVPGGAMSVTVEAPTAAALAPAPHRDRRRQDVLADALIVAVLGVVALVLRWHFPTDGLFYDDAWQALGPAKASLGQLLTVAEGQAGFALGLMGWSRIFGDGPSSMVTPAIIFGVLGPPALFLTLRYFRFARSIALILGAALCAVGVHINFSFHVKSYTADIIMVLLVTIVVARLAPRRWTPRVGVGWVVGAFLVASFSAVGPLVSLAGGLTLVLHPRHDLRVRVIAFAAQCVSIAVYIVVVMRTFDSDLVNEYWKSYDAFIEHWQNPFEFVPSVVEHLVRMTSIFTDERRSLAYVVLVVAVAGLVGAAWRGRRVVPARFLGLVLLAAIGGSAIGRVPFGPRSLWAGRISLWLAPVLAFGVAVAFEYVRRRVGGSVKVRAAFDGIAVAVTALLLLGAFGPPHVYEFPGAREATRQVMAEHGPNDVVWITRPAVYSFALSADAPLHIDPTPGSNVGYVPDFEDPNILTLDYSLDPEAMKRSVKNADEVRIVHAKVLPTRFLAKYRLSIGLTLDSFGFKPRSSRTVGTGTIDVFERKKPAPGQ